MHELSLFSGACLGVCGTHHLLGWRTVGYVEIDDYCQRVIAQRIRDGVLDDAPIFGDIRAFIRDGYAASYTGLVDVITAGFPCQPFSSAGKRLGEADDRNMWPETIECIRIVRPRYVLLENVSALLAHPYARTIFGDLAESGFDCRWRRLSAAEVGAPHLRNRIWIVSDAQRERLERVVEAGTASRATDGPGDGRDSGWWTVEPGVGRVVDGCPARMDRLKALGNGQVPAVVASAWRLL